MYQLEGLQHRINKDQAAARAAGPRRFGRRGLSAAHSLSFPARLSIWEVQTGWTP